MPYCQLVRLRARVNNEIIDEDMYVCEQGAAASLLKLHPEVAEWHVASLPPPPPGAGLTLFRRPIVGGTGITFSATSGLIREIEREDG